MGNGLFLSKSGNIKRWGGKLSSPRVLGHWFVDFTPKMTHEIGKNFKFCKTSNHFN